MMISSATAGSEWFLNGVANLNQQLTKTDQELSSGYQIQDASNSPAQTPALVELGSQLATVQNYQTNLTRVQAEAQGADQALGSAITSIDSALTLGAEGANSSNSAATDQTLAGQIQSIQQQVVSLANTTVAGRYIFGGSADQTAPYQYDAASATGVDQLTTSSAGEVFVNPQGQPVYQPLTAQQIFAPVDDNGNPVAGNTFAALQSLETALTNDDQAGIAAAVTSLQSASDYLGQQQAYYGTAEQRITSEQNNSASQSTALQAQISGIRDTNVTQAASDLTEESTAQTAAYSAEAEISPKSLFDYLG
jgi:flagellar hook-associated protein 3 FlgL